MKNLQITAQITPRDSRTVDTYLRDIAQQPLLTVDEEVELAQKIRQGDERALERLVLGNLRFVVSVAKKYQNRGLPLSDLISAGNIGLVIAAKRFDETHGNKFCSYAVWWIRQSIMQAIAKEGRTVTLPANQLGLLSKVNRETSLLEQELQRSPSRAEVVDRLQETLTSGGNVEKHLSQLMHVSQQTVSLNAPVIDDEELTIIDTLTDPSAPATDDGLMRESLHDDIDDVLSNLPQGEQNIIRMYFGIGHSHAYSMDEIGMRIGMSRERVRQLHNKALTRLRRSTTKERLRAYLNS